MPDWSKMTDADRDLIRELGRTCSSQDMVTLARLLREHPEALDLFNDTAISYSAFIEMEHAMQDNSLSVIKTFLDAGFDINQSDVPESDVGLIKHAAGAGHIDLVRWLMDRGARINGTRYGKNVCFALTSAARGGHLEIVRLLVDRGADLTASWMGKNALMDATPEVAEFLRSVGMKDVRETTPHDYSVAHKTLLYDMKERSGKPSEWQLDLPGYPLIRIRHILADPNHEEFSGQTLFTLGLSDHRIHDGDDEFHCTELRILLPPDWPFTPESLSDPEWNWPVEWMKRIASELRSADHMDYPPFFMNGDPPQPLASNTNLCGWVGLRSGENHRQMPDWRWVSLLDLFPIYPEERQMIQSQGQSAFAQCLQQRGIPTWIDPNRPSVANDEVSEGPSCSIE